MTVPASGWYVEVDAPGGQTWTPTVFDERAELSPGLYDLKRATVPVRSSDQWRAADFERSAMRVWVDGERQPIEELVAVTDGPGAVTKLVGVGGVELQGRVTRQFDQISVSDAAEDIINDTSYTANVDASPSTTDENVTVQTPGSASDLATLSLAGATDPFADKGNGEYGPVQTCFTQEAENGTLSGTDTLIRGEYSGSSPTAGAGIAEGLKDLGDSIEWTFDLDYTVPSGSWEWAIRWDTGDGSDVPTIEWSLDGTALGTYSPFTTSTVGNPDWTALLTRGFTDPGDVSSGSHTLKAEVITGGTETWYVDVVAPYDTRFSYTFDNTTTTGPNGGSWLDGPELYPDAADVAFDDYNASQTVTGGRIEASVTDTTGTQAVALSNDRGASYPLTAANTGTLEGDFAADGGFLRFKATLGRYGSGQNDTPRDGYLGQALTDYTLKADLADIPLLVDQVYDGQVVDVLGNIAQQYGDAVWALGTDGSGGITVEWTEPGQRTESGSPSIADFETTKSVEDAYERVIVKGSKQRRAGESVTANHGTFVALDNDDIVLGQESVRDATTDQQFAYGTDYDLNVQAGEIRTLSSGDISDGQSLVVDYFHVPVGSHTVSGATQPIRERVVTLSQLPTERGCQQVARRLAEDLSKPLYEASVDLPASASSFSVVAALDLSGVPYDALEPHGVVETPEGQRLRLGSRQSATERIGQLRSRLASTSDRV